MRKENIGVGAVILAALVCILLVFLIEEVRYTPNDVKFAQPPALSETAVELNSAGSEELQTVEGIGEKIAEKIIEFRETERPFETVEDLMLMKGFGRSKLEDVMGNVYVKQIP